MVHTKNYTLGFLLVLVGLLVGCDAGTGLTDTDLTPEAPFAKLGDAKGDTTLLFPSKPTLPFGKTSWNQFGRDAQNTSRINAMGPIGGIGSTTTLTPTTGTIGSEVGVITNVDDDYIVSSYDPYIHVFDASGTHKAYYALSGSYGPRAVPFYDNVNNFIFTGAESGGFYEIALTKSGSTYTLTLNSSLGTSSVGTIESSPVMAIDGTLYVTEQWGTVHRFSTNPLTIMASYSLGEVVTGATALYDIDGDGSEEVLVATQSGNFYALEHDLSAVYGSNTYGASYGDQYYSGVTVAERGTGSDPIAVLGVTGGTASSPSVYTGNIRAINLTTMAVEWEFTPSNTTTGGSDEVQGSIAILHARSGTYMGVASSTDQYVYGFDLISGTESWSYHMGAVGKAAPAIGRFNAAYVVDGAGYLHVLQGATGTSVYTDGSMYIGSTSDIGKVAIGQGQKLGIGSGNTAYILHP